MDQHISATKAESWSDGGPHVIAVAALGTLLTSSALVAAMFLFVLRGLH